MFKKLFAIIIAATLTLSIAGSAFATFEDLQLIRVVYERTTGSTETLTDLGNVTSVLAAGGTFAGSLPTVSTAANLAVAYFALDSTNGQLWATSKNGQSLGDLTTISSGTVNLYSYYNATTGIKTTKGTTTTGQAFGVGSQSAANSYKSKLSAAAGSLGGALPINSAESSLATLVGATSGSVGQNLYFWANGYANVAADYTGVIVATITTNFDGSTTISPPPAAATAPGKPTIGTATATGDGTAQVAFNAPTDNGGSTITLYTATSIPEGKTGTSTGTSPITVNGLTNGTSYKFTVTAKNAAGISVASADSNSVTTTGGGTTPTTQTIVFGAPTAVTATAGNAQATVRFTVPASTGGSTITGYTVTSATGGFTATGTASPITVTGLTNGTAYTFSVTATNSKGAGPAGTSNSVTPATVAGVPTSVTATAGNAQTTVSFTAPASNGGGTITVYTVTSAPGGFTATGAASPITITGLTNGTAYTFTVAATNAAGKGADSAASNSVMPTIPPITFTVFPTSGDHGKIAPATNLTVVASATASFVITPDSGYQIATVTGCDGKLNRSTSTYTTAGILNNCTVEAKFIAIPSVALQDALKALRFAIGLEIPTDADIASGDVAPLKGCVSNTAGKLTCTKSPDGKIDIADVVAIMQKSVGNLTW